MQPRETWTLPGSGRAPMGKAPQGLFGARVSRSRGLAGFERRTRYGAPDGGGILPALRRSLSGQRGGPGRHLRHHRGSSRYRSPRGLRGHPAQVHQRPPRQQRAGQHAVILKRRPIRQRTPQNRLLLRPRERRFPFRRLRRRHEPTRPTRLNLDHRLLNHRPSGRGAFDVFVQNVRQAVAVIPHRFSEGSGTNRAPRPWENGYADERT